MKVTLYKNCKLNNKYKDVFFNKEFLEIYLGQLDYKVILTDDYIFSREQDNLIIDDTDIPNFKEYNYIKIEDTINTFYAFINNIKWINSVYIIYYEEDIMSNWFENVHIRNSLLTANKSLKLYKGNSKRNINYYTVPIEPKSNNYLSFKGFNIEDLIDNEKPKMSIILKIQKYKLDQAGNQSEREPLIGVVSYTDNSTIPTNKLFEFEFYTINSNIMEIINSANVHEITTDTYYELDKIYVVPSNFIELNNFTNVITSLTDSVNNRRLELNYYSLEATNYTGLKKTYIKTINYDIKNDSVGLFSVPIKIVNNGTDILTKIEFYYMGYGIKFILNVQNKIIDITEEFNVDIPFYQLNASAVQLQRLQLELQENYINNKIDNSNEEIDRNKERLALGVTSNLIGGVSSAISGNIGGAIKGSTNAISSVIESSSNIDIYENDIKYSKDRINLINKSLYSNSSIRTNKYSIMNGILGLCLFQMQIDNETQVNEGIKLCGYNVRELVNDVIQELDIDNLTDNYDIFKFDEVNLYGVISQEYTRFIENVLLRGVRVWCQGDIGDLVNV